MIVRDEEDVIERCLNCVHDLVDEIIIVDTGSKDSTKEIVSKFTDKIYDFEWIDDFSAARNYSFSKATMEYIFYVDADDIMYDEDREKFKALKESLDPSIDSVTMTYNIAFDDSNNPTFSYKRHRLVKREKNFKWVGECHNVLSVSGKTIHSDIGIAHKKLHSSSDRNLRIYQKRLRRGDTFDTRDIFYYANELYENNLLEESLVYYNKLLEMEKGWFENKIYACGRVSDYYTSIKNYSQAFEYAFKSFQYAVPRADFLCRIGTIFKRQKKFHKAIYWYTLAANSSKPDSMGFIKNAYWTYIPNLELCVCYDKIGNHDLAFTFNEIARSFAPKDKSVLQNVEYFKKLGFEVDQQHSDS